MRDKAGETEDLDTIQSTDAICIDSRIMSVISQNLHFFHVHSAIYTLFSTWISRCARSVFRRSDRPPTLPKYDRFPLSGPQGLSLLCPAYPILQHRTLTALLLLSINPLQASGNGVQEARNTNIASAACYHR